jgi:hypothetical protein
MTEPWQIHVCPVHGPRTPTMLGDCPVGCCAEVMKVVRVVRDTRGDGVDVLAHYPERVRIDRTTDTGRFLGPFDADRTNGRSDMDSCIYVRADIARGAVEALERYGWHRGDCPAIFVDGPGSCVCGWSKAATALGLFGGQSTAEEAFEQ